MVLCEIISVGDELLSGFILNRNAAIIGEKLTEIGCMVRWITAIGDDQDELLKAFDQAFRRANIIVVTGGLGPTHDDVTKKAVSEFFHSKLVFKPAVLSGIEALFRKLGRNMADVNREQACLPDEAELIDNEIGTAPGMIFHREGRTFYFLPGVSSEMKNMMERAVIPDLKQLSGDTGVRYRVLRTANIPESDLYEKIQDFQTRFPEIKLAFLPQNTGVQIRLTTSGLSEKESENAFNRCENFIRQKAGTYIYGTGDEAIEMVVGKLLRDRNFTLSVAESCTGGLVAHKITNVPGSSAYFDRSIVTYSNRAKMELLKVPEETLQKFGAVSGETAIAMAEGIRCIGGTDIGLSVTGIAGPGGGSSEKPVGLVFVGYADDSRSLFEQYRFLRDRRWNRERSAVAALDLVRRVLLGLKEIET